MPSRWLVVLLALLVTGCSGGTNQGAPSGASALATTSTLASLASGVTGSAVPSLVPIGVSPEDYQPAPHDIEVLHAAKVLVENGAGLEAWLDATIHNAA